MTMLGYGFDEFARYLAGLIVATEDYALFNGRYPWLCHLQRRCLNDKRE